MKCKWKEPSTNRGIGRATTLLFLVAVLALNIVIYALATHFSWYFYTADRYEHEIGDTLESKLSSLSHPVSVRFCMAEEDLEKEVVYSLVYNTARQYAERYENIKLLPSYNIYTDFRALQEYREKADAAISTSTVIIESEMGVRFLNLSDFFHLNSEQQIRDYNGEEVFASMFLWLQKAEDEHPTVYFTKDHGENYAITGLSLQLMMAGYSLETIELSLENIPSDAAFVVISNPIYDFDRSSAASAVVSELDRLTAYLDNGGSLYVTFDAASDSYGNLKNLREVLSMYGITPNDGLINDYRNSVTVDGKTLTVTYPESGKGYNFGTEAALYNSSRVIAKNTASLSLSEENEKNAAVYPLLVTSEYAEDESGVRGVTPVSAIAETASGGILFVSGSGYLAYSEFVNSQSYGNETLLYLTLEAFGCEDDPIGCTTFSFTTATLENLTVGESNAFFTVASAVLPALLLSAAAFVCIRRKRR